MSITKIPKKTFKFIKFDLNSYKNKNYLTHNFHSYPAKFVPQIPEIVIEKLSKPGDIILDPFCGSGTTLVEAKLLGRNSVGFDINPIAILITKSKTTILNELQFAKVRKNVIKIQKTFNSHSTNKSKKYEIPHILNVDLWFQKNVQTELAIIKKIIELEKDMNVRDFMLTAFSAIITSVSNQISDTKYASTNKNIKDGQTVKKFTQKIDNMIERLREFSYQTKNTDAIVHNCSVVSIKPIKKESIDLIITSPPYANTYDYYLYHRHRMEWLGYDFRAAQSLEIGSRNKHSDEDMAIQSYLDSMKSVFTELNRVLKKNKYFVIIIGDSIKDGKLIKMNEEYTKIGQECGFLTKQCFSYDLRKYSAHFRWVGSF